MEEHHQYITKMMYILDNLALLRIFRFIYDPIHNLLVRNIIKRLIKIKEFYNYGYISKDEFMKLREKYITTIARSCGSLSADSKVFWDAYIKLKDAQLITDDERQWYIEQSRLSRWF